MPNVTISVDEKTLRASREYARRHRTSLNALIRDLLRQRVLQGSTDWVDECFALADEAAGSSRGKRWTRDDAYDV